MDALRPLCALAVLLAGGKSALAAAPDLPHFSRHVVSVFSSLGCNRGMCHGASYSLQVHATFADGTTEDVTALCTYSSLDAGAATGRLSRSRAATGRGPCGLIFRFRAEPVIAQVIMAHEGASQTADAQPLNFIDEQVLTVRRFGL